ncbi:MAG: ATP-binding protein [Bacteroidales bacterium]|nr:ATP-binding protein [Bacteroidales bacterium]
MKLKISKLGHIDSMVIDMSKPFILFAGDNGTGKTYAATFLYTLIWELRFMFFSPSFIKTLEKKELPITKKLKSGVDGKVRAEELYNLLEEFLKKRQKEILVSMNLNIPTETFRCEIATTKEEWKEELWNKSVSVWSRFIQKKVKSFDYKLRWPNEEQIPYLQGILAISLFFDGIMGAKMFTAERSGIYTFNKELSVGRLRNPEERFNARYPKPIADGLADAADVVNQRKKESEYHEFADEIEQMVLHGNLTVSEEGEVLYRVSDDIELGFNESSSAIKTLAPLVFYLRHSAGQFNILFVDEPELNLHPKNQILLAKIFVKMINAGLRLVISTHSDYIIREINNMIMADGLNKAGDKIFSNKGYDESLCLSQDKFAPYLFQKGENGKVKVEPLEVDRYGFNMPSIDEAINSQNDVTNTFYEVLKYDHPKS